VQHQLPGDAPVAAVVLTDSPLNGPQRKLGAGDAPDDLVIDYCFSQHEIRLDIGWHTGEAAIGDIVKLADEHRLGIYAPQGKDFCQPAREA
jgi:hypothetical protein